MKKVKSILLLISLGGMALIVYGVSMWSEPMAFVIAGFWIMAVVWNAWELLKSKESP